MPDIPCKAGVARIMGKIFATSAPGVFPVEHLILSLSACFILAVCYTLDYVFIVQIFASTCSERKPEQEVVRGISSG